MVDSIDEKVTPLSSWTPPTDRHPGQIHTMAGLLPQAAIPGYSGWGLLDTAVQQTFEPATAAYYPSARRRFGFYDSLGNLGRGTGKVSYFVVGWFWDDQHDPLARAARPATLLDAWKSVASTDLLAVADFGTTVTLDDARQPPAASFNFELQVSPAAFPSTAKLLSVQRAVKADGKGTPVNERMIRVQDARKTARSLGLGPTTDGSGSDGAGWWIDITDIPALTQLLVTSSGARVSLPTVGHLYTVPGPAGTARGRRRSCFPTSVATTNLGPTAAFVPTVWCKRASAATRWSVWPWASRPPSSGAT